MDDEDALLALGVLALGGLALVTLGLKLGNKSPGWGLNFGGEGGERRGREPIDVTSPEVVSPDEYARRKRGL